MVNGSSTERVLADLRRHATAGRAGDLLPSTRELVARHGVGPVTVSRAVARLAAEGVVISEPGRGTFVAPPRPGATAEPADLGWQTVMLADRTVGADELLELLAPPEPGTMIGVAPSRSRDLQPLNALRHPLVGRSNGWFVWRGGAIPREQDDFFKPSHIEHIMDDAPGTGALSRAAAGLRSGARPRLRGCRRVVSSYASGG